MHYLPEPPLTSNEIRLHQTARDMINSRAMKDLLWMTRGVEPQIHLTTELPQDRPAAVVEINIYWLAALCAALTAAYTLLTKVLIGPIIGEQVRAISISKEFFLEAHRNLRRDVDKHIRTTEKELDNIWKELRSK
jgi:hypothetical protein